MREECVVSQLVGAFGEEVVHFVGAEFLFTDAAHLLPVVQATGAQEATNRQVHRVVGGDHIDAPDLDLLVEQPLAEAVMGAGMALDIAFFIAFGRQERIFVPAGVDDQDVAIAHFNAFFNIFWPENIQVVQHIAQVHNDAGAIEPFQWQLVDGLAIGDKVLGRIQVGAHVVGGLDILGIDAMFRFALEVFHFKGRIEGPKRAVGIERLRKVVEFCHGYFPSVLGG